MAKRPMDNGTMARLGSTRLIRSMISQALSMTDWALTSVVVRLLALAIANKLRTSAM
ncbi:hypothetical protein D3C76_1765540 [compost metagenome]